MVSALKIFKHTQDHVKALMIAVTIYNDRKTRNYQVDQWEKDIAELREKLGEQYDDVRAKAETETVDSIIEKLKNDYQPKP